MTGGLNWPMRVQNAMAVSTPTAQHTGRSPIAECFSNFLRPELPFDHHEGWVGCRNYVALWIWCFYGYFVHCVVIQEQFVGLGRLQSPAFLCFKWRNNNANKTKPKTRLKRLRIPPKLHTRHKDKLSHVKVIEVYFHIHNCILAF